MAYNAQALVTEAEVENYLQLQTAQHSTAVEYIVNGVCDEFRRHAGHDFVSTVYTAVKLTGDGTPKLWLPNWPVTTLTSVAEDTVTRTVDVDFYADMVNGVLEKVPSNFPFYNYQGVWTTKVNAIVLTYTAGYTLASTLPADIRLAALKEIARQYQQFILKQHGETSRSQEGSSVSFKDGPDWKTVIDRYRRPRI